MDVKKEIVLFTDNDVRLEVPITPERETVRLTQEQMSELFDTARSSIAYHISNIFKEDELDKDSSVEIFDRTIGRASRPPQYYNLDVIISVGYRVKSKRGVAFRKWANVMKGVESIMGGEILELEVDKILNRGIDIGKADGMISTLTALVRDGLLDLAEGARRANMTQEEFARKVKDA